MLNIAYSGVNSNWLKGVSGWIKLLLPPSCHRQGQTHQWEILGMKKPTYLLSLPGAQLDRDCAGGRWALAGSGASAELWAALPEPEWAGREVRPRSVLVVAIALLPGGDLLLLPCGCLHCQGTSKFPNILLVQQGKALGCSKTNCFGCRKLRGEEVTGPSLASASCQQHLLEVISLCFHLCMATLYAPSVKMIQHVKVLFKVPSDHSDRMRLGNIYKLQLAGSRTECKRLQDLRAVTSGGKQEQGTMWTWAASP